MVELTWTMLENWSKWRRSTQPRPARSTGYIVSNERQTREVPRIPTTPICNLDDRNVMTLLTRSDAARKTIYFASSPARLPPNTGTVACNATMGGLSG
jgi:hypothetical protein